MIILKWAIIIAVVWILGLLIGRVTEGSWRRGASFAFFLAGITAASAIIVGVAALLGVN